MAEDDLPKIDPEDFGERFLRLNARPDYIASRFADVLRGLMRGVGSQDASGPVAKAAYEMNQVWELVRRCEEPINFHTIFEGAVSEVRQNLWDEEDRYSRRMKHVAIDGLMYLIEESCSDGFAKGRASKRYSTFRSAMESEVNPRK